MSFSQSLEYQMESAVSDLFADIAGLNVYTTNRTGAKNFPYVSISCRPVRQLVGPYSGVYELAISVNYSQTSAKYTETQFDEEYLEVFGSLYSTPTELSEKIQDTSSDIKVYMARISSQTPSINLGKRSWQKGITITAIATLDELASGIFAYQFDKANNSFYLATI